MFKKHIMCAIFLFLTVGLVVNGLAFSTDSKKADESHTTLLPVMTDIPPRSEKTLSKIDPDPQPTMSYDDIPNQFSWTNFGGNWVTPVKDQAYPVYCGSCYIFAVWGAFEAAIDIASGNPDTDMDLSEQYGLSCINSGCNGCGGGWGSTMLDNIVSESPGQSGNGINGVPIEACMPYTATDSVPCSDKCSDWDQHSEPLVSPDDKLWQVKSWGAFSISEDSQSDWNLLKTQLIDKGPIAVTIAWTNSLQDFVENNHSPNDVYEHDDSGSTNHLILLVGWKDDPTILNGGYWILKNSHGTSQGYGGYCNIAYGCNALGVSECDWVIAEEWPEMPGPGPIDVDMAVFADFSYCTDQGDHCPHIGDEIQFTDTSDGDIALREWDFDGDGSIDSTQKNPTWTYNEEGDYEVTLTVKGEFGLESNRTYMVSVKEVWPPEAIIPCQIVDNTLTYSFNGRYSKDRDGGTIVSYSWDFDDGSTAEGSMVTHTFSEPDKVYDVTLTVTDNDGASESAVCSVKIDQSVPPVTTINHGIGGKDDSWYGSTQRITIEATDWSEVIDTFYRIDEEEWQSMSTNNFITVAGEGTHTVEAYSVDYYGTEETPVLDSFGIDKSAPVIDVTIQGENVGEWYTSPVQVTLDGSDALSGLDQITYKINTGGWQQYTGSFTLDEGIHQIWAVAVDNAGNTVDEQVLVKVDTGAPTADCTFVGEGSNNKFYQSVKVQVYGIDPGSGVDKVYYKIDSGSFKVYTGPVTVDTIGDHTVEFYAVDNLGNEGNCETRSFTVSPVNFEMNLDQPENALYIFGIKLFSLEKPVLIGPVTVKVSVDPFTNDPALLDHVEFFVDDESKHVDTQSPFEFKLTGPLFASHSLRIDAVAGEETVSETLQATCIIP